MRFLADTHLELGKALGIELDASAMLGNVRCKRFAAVVDNGKVRPRRARRGRGTANCDTLPAPSIPTQITKFLLEPTGGGLEKSTAENVLAAL